MTANFYTMHRHHSPSILFVIRYGEICFRFQPRGSASARKVAPAMLADTAALVLPPADCLLQFSCFSVLVSLPEFPPLLRQISLLCYY